MLSDREGGLERPGVVDSHEVALIADQILAGFA